MFEYFRDEGEIIIFRSETLRTPCRTANNVVVKESTKKKHAIKALTDHSVRNGRKPSRW